MNSSAYNDADVDESNDDGHYGAPDECTGDLVWARALSKLKSKIMPKLRSESIEGEYLSSTNKKEKVDVHIEPDFQMAYFFRKSSGRHAVLLKEKQLTFLIAAATTTSNTTMPPPALPASAMQKSTARDAMPISRLASRQSNQTDDVVGLGSEIATDAIPAQTEAPSAARKRNWDEVDSDFIPMEGVMQPVKVKIEDEEEDDVQLLDGPTDADVPSNPESIDVDAMQDDKKPKLHVKYSGFKIFGKCFIVVIEPTKRTKRLRPALFETIKPVERHQLSATPLPRQSRETPVPSSVSNGRQRSLSLAQEGDDDDTEDRERGDSRRDGMSAGLFRGTPSDWTPTPTPEPERQRGDRRQEETRAQGDEDMDVEESTSVMLATQMLEGGIAGHGNDIDDE
jgi:hypothetical protein